MKFSELPKLGAPLDAGLFAGIITRKDGTHCAVVLLPERGTQLTWNKAVAWAKDQDGELPSRPVAAMLFANVLDQLKPEWRWTSEEFNAAYAWGCYFGSGYQLTDHKSYEGSAVAVRYIKVTP